MIGLIILMSFLFSVDAHTEARNPVVQSDQPPMDSLNSNAPSLRQPESQFCGQSSSVRETGSEIFIQSTLPSVTSAINDAAAEGIMDEPLGDAMPEEVIITVNVSEWDPEKACASEDNLETGASSVDSPASSDE